MERIVLLLLCVLCLVTIGASLKAQAEQEKRDHQIVISPVPISTDNQKAELNIVSKQLSLQEYNISLYVLIFGATLLLFELGLILFKHTHPNVIKFIIVTIVLITSPYLITAGYSLRELSPVLGVLGTVAGYILGKSQVSINASTREALSDTYNT